MSCPRIEVDLDKIRRNTETVVRRLDPRGIDVTGVTKAVCGHPAIAQAMLDGGALGASGRTYKQRAEATSSRHHLPGHADPNTDVKSGR